MRNKIEDYAWLLNLLVWALLLPYVANTTGWLFTEIARQPWIVFGLQLTQDGVSPLVTQGMVWMSLIGFTVLYGVLMAVDVYLLQKFAKTGTGEMLSLDVDESPTGEEPAGSLGLA
jgi:cytochrome bd ubiquinol oxidase subunit I